MGYVIKIYIKLKKNRIFKYLNVMFYPCHSLQREIL